MRWSLHEVGRWLNDAITNWLVFERPAEGTPLCDFERLAYEVRPADVILVEGRSRVGDVIKLITQSPWTHSMLYIGRLFDIEDPSLRGRVRQFYRGDPHDQLLIEAVMGKGTVVTRLSDYDQDHLRICRPRSLAARDAQTVINYAIERLGTEYDTRQLLDLARFLFPYTVLPRRWRSSLFQHNAGVPTRTVCSTMLAEAFAKVGYPVLPHILLNGNQPPRFYRRNPKLFAPRDFDYSPYFDIVKYPFLAAEAELGYRELSWNEDAVFDDLQLTPSAPEETGSETDSSRQTLSARVFPIRRGGTS